MDIGQEIQRVPQPTEGPEFDSERARRLVFPPDKTKNASWTPAVPFLEWRQDLTKILRSGDVLYFDFRSDLVSGTSESGDFYDRIPFMATGDVPLLPQHLREAGITSLGQLTPLLSSPLDPQIYRELEASTEVLESSPLSAIVSGIGERTVNLFNSPRLVVGASADNTLVIAEDTGGLGTGDVLRKGSPDRVLVSTYTLVDRSLEEQEIRQNLMTLEKEAAEKSRQAGKGGLLKIFDGLLQGGLALGSKAALEVRPELSQVIRDSEHRKQNLWQWKQYRINQANTQIAKNGGIPVRGISIQHLK